VAVAAPSDKRFRRAQVKPARKRGVVGRQALRVLRVAALLGAIGYGAYRAHDLVLHASFLQVTRVVVRGNDRLATGEVLSLVEGLRGQSIVALDLQEWRRTLQKSPWVDEVSLRRRLPSTIEIDVTERQPMGIGRVGRELFLVDARGVIIDEYGPNYAEFDLPIIDGLRAPPGGAGLVIDESRAVLASRLLAAVHARKDFAHRISQIDVSNVRDAVVVLEGETALIRLGDENFVERLQAYVDLAGTLHARIPDIEYVDLRFDGRVYVRPAAGSRQSVAPARSGATARPGQD
jgi:cell division protein FtsQ